MFDLGLNDALWRLVVSVGIGLVVVAAVIGYVVTRGDDR